MVIFFLSGLGNGSTYKMIPSIFALLGRKHAAETGAEPAGAAVEFKRRAAAVIGIAGAIGAFGGVLIQVVLRQASLNVSALVKAAKTPAAKVAVAAAHSNWSVPALWVFLVSYLVLRRRHLGRLPEQQGRLRPSGGVMPAGVRNRASCPAGRRTLVVAGNGMVGPPAARDTGRAGRHRRVGHRDLLRRAPRRL